jgi:polygalacturonase
MPKRTLLPIAAGLMALAGLAAAAPSASLDVRAFGARGDGLADDAPAINAAISAAAGGGGGTVEFPAGTYLSGSIHLMSRVALHLGPGSTIVASSDRRAYDPPEPNAWGDSLHYQDGGHSHWHDSLIWGEDLTDVAITGQGTIYGKGLSRGWSKETAPQDVGNKAIALKNCRNVALRDFTIAHGGWFGILATGVDNLVIDGLRIDTNRDGMDIDCCRNVRISNCSVNSPWDDGICLKSSFGLGQFRSTENVTISDCLVSGYDEGSLLDGSRTHTAAANPWPTGRIKFGTESNGGFQAVTVTNCVFECCRGLALETVDGALLEDVTVSNLAMRRIFGAPIFLRVGQRMRGPANTPVGVIRRVLVSHIAAEGVTGGQAILIAGIKGHPVEDLTLDDIRIEFEGGGTAAQAGREPPELERDYPEPGNFGTTPAWGLYARHARNLVVHHVVMGAAAADLRPPVSLVDVDGAQLEHVSAPLQPGVTGVSLSGVEGFSAESCSVAPEAGRTGTR